jgi:hypothetical protein
MLVFIYCRRDVTVGTLIANCTESEQVCCFVYCFQHIENCLKIALCILIRSVSYVRYAILGTLKKLHLCFILNLGLQLIKQYQNEIKSLPFTIFKETFLGIPRLPQECYMLHQSDGLRTTMHICVESDRLWRNWYHDISAIQALPRVSLIHRHLQSRPASCVCDFHPPRMNLHILFQVFSVKYYIRIHILSSLGHTVMVFHYFGGHYSSIKRVCPTYELLLLFPLRITIQHFP